MATGINYVMVLTGFWRQVNFPEKIIFAKKLFQRRIKMKVSAGIRDLNPTLTLLAAVADLNDPISGYDILMEFETKRRKNS